MKIVIKKNLVIKKTDIALQAFLKLLSNVVRIAWIEMDHFYPPFSYTTFESP